MARKSINDLPDAFVSTSETSNLVSKGVQSSKLRKLASRLYTKDLKSAPESITRRNLWQIVAGYFPDALIADRTAIEGRPSKDGSVFLISQTAQSDVLIPGFKLRPRRGAPAQSDDLPFMGVLRLSSRHRAVLDNFVASRARDAVSRTLAKKEMEAYLDSILRHAGEDELNRLRDDARRLALLIDRGDEFASLNKMIGALLNTQTDRLQTSSGRARKKGVPFDPDRVDLFEVLRAELHALPPQIRAAAPGNETTLPFFEAYFSNFIEGTEFGVEEAAAIVFENRIPGARPQDAHDILGTYRIVADQVEMSRVPSDFTGFERLLKRRHGEIMQARPEKRPGQYKTEPNRAGGTAFVAPGLVRGTLDQGFKVCRSLTSPFQRAVFMMFLISEVHPFADGNGRIARIMMNAELVAAGEQRIIIPTIYRSNYLTALNALSNRTNVPALARTLEFAQRFTQRIDWTDFKLAQASLTSANAFMDSKTADDNGIRLRLPHAGQ